MKKSSLKSFNNQQRYQDKINDKRQRKFRDDDTEKMADKNQSLGWGFHYSKFHS